MIRIFRKFKWISSKKQESRLDVTPMFQKTDRYCRNMASDQLEKSSPHSGEIEEMKVGIWSLGF